MIPIPWSEKEWKSLLSTCAKHEAWADAVAAHNAIWKFGRSPESVRNKVCAMGHGKVRSLLKPPTPAARRMDDLPAHKSIDRLCQLVKQHKDAGITYFCDALELPPKRLKELILLARSMGRALEIGREGKLSLGLEAPEVDRYAVHRLTVAPVDDTIVFAAIADTHYGSKHHRGECLRDFIDLAYGDFGVREVLVAGDLLAGHGVYKGQTFDLSDPSFEGQAEQMLRDLPKHPGMTYRTIGGNHDESFYKSNGADILRRVGTSGRKDIQTYGYHSALIDLKPEGRPYGIKAELHHMKNAGGYALSYYLQKTIENIPPGMKPQLLFCGHPHVSAQLPDYRGVAGYLCGCFEDQTSLLKRMHVHPSIGGWILKVGITKDGHAKSLQSTFVRYAHSRRGPLIGRTPDGEVRLERRVGIPGD